MSTTPTDGWTIALLSTRGRDAVTAYLGATGLDVGRLRGLYGVRVRIVLNARVERAELLTFSTDPFLSLTPRRPRRLF